MRNEHKISEFVVRFDPEYDSLDKALEIIDLEEQRQTLYKYFKDSDSSFHVFEEILKNDRSDIITFLAILGLKRFSDFKDNDSLVMDQFRKKFKGWI